MLWILGAGLIVFILLSLKYCWWRPTVGLEHPRILMYHMIGGSLSKQKHRGLRVSPEMFERQVAWLKASNWTFIKASELFTEKAQGDKRVAITFDDGYEDNYSQALPILKKYDACATLYLVTDRHERDWSVNKNAKHNSGDLMREAKLSDKQVAEMLASGVFELGGHTLTHCHLPSVDMATKTFEINECKKVLNATFATQVTSFAYPFGHYSDEDIKLCQAADFNTAVTTDEGIDTQPNAFRLKRVKVSGKDNFFAFKTRIRIGFRGHI
jgi:peptidoglycan/xylan/chitin deacetylase (PgdA/CDA1 family)